MLDVPDSPDVSVTRRIVTAVHTAIREGRYKPGDKLPARLVLAQQLGVTGRTVGDAYSRLEVQGLVTSRVGSGTYVSDEAPRRLGPTGGDVRFKTITIVAGVSDISLCPYNALHVLTDISAGIREILGEVKINLVESFNQACLGDLAHDDALVVCRPREIDPAMLRALEKREVPVVRAWASARLNKMGLIVPHVDYDRALAARLACEHLLACGYRRIGFIGLMGKLVSLNFFEFANALYRAKLDYHVRHVRDVPDARPGAAYRAALQIVREGDVPEAFFVDAAYKAMEVVAALKDAGLKVPEDVGVVGRNDIPEAALWCDPPLTTVRIPWRAIGRHIAEMFRNWKHDRTPLQSLMLAPDLVVRGTTRAAAETRRPSDMGLLPDVMDQTTKSRPSAQ